MSSLSYPEVDLPDAVRQRAVAAGSVAWLDALPRLINELCTEWQLTLGQTYSDATEAFVAEVIRSDGTAAVLKILLASDAHNASQEITVLRLADGTGCAQLFAADETRGALLLERLGRPMAQLD
ncbi:MAG: aminoglycoside phosphotransferase family protein, partial [Pseudomonadota bacterium]